MKKGTQKNILIVVISLFVAAFLFTSCEMAQKLLGTPGAETPEAIIDIYVDDNEITNGTVNVGDDVTLDASRSSDPSGNPLTSYTWTLFGAPFGFQIDEENPPVQMGLGIFAYFTADLTGEYVVQLRVQGRSGLATVQVNITVIDPSQVNQDPVADAGPDQTITQLSAGGDDVVVQFDGSGSTDDGYIESYSWDWDDGTPDGSGVDPTHTYISAGTYTVTLTVWDDEGAKRSSV